MSDGAPCSVEELEAEAERIAALRNDPRTPAIVRRAFLRPCVLTLRKYLALEDADSPVLTGRWSASDAGALAGEFLTAWGIVYPARAVPAAQHLGEAISEMDEAVIQAFATVMPMRFPRTPGAHAVHEPSDGLGWGARMVARFVGMGWRTDDVLDLPLDLLFIVSAGLQANEGAECAGDDYRERNAGMLKAETGDRKGSGAGGEAVGVKPAEDPKNQGRENQGSGENDGNAPTETALNVPVEPVPESGHDKTPSGSGEKVHTESVA
jgi:hypothetical protein